MIFNYIIKCRKTKKSNTGRLQKEERVEFSCIGYIDVVEPEYPRKNLKFTWKKIIIRWT